MDKKMYLAKAIKVNNQVVDYEVKMQVDKPFKPRGGGYEILYGVETKFPKASLVGGVWEVVEDVVKKGQKESKENQKELDKAFLKDLDVKKIKNLDEVKDLLEKLLKHLFNS